MFCSAGTLKGTKYSLLVPVSLITGFRSNSFSLAVYSVNDNQKEKKKIS